jgi:hypothetical protein
MLVKELIELLKDVPQDYEILMESGWDHAVIDITVLDGDEDREVILVPLG